MVLTYHTAIPSPMQPGVPLVVLLHGRGTDEYDLAGLAPFLPDGWGAVFPRAPFPGQPWGYGPGWAWYRFLGDTTPEPEGFLESQRAVGELLDRLPGELPVRPGPMVVGGFSQGGTMALAFALRHRGRVAAVLNFSGFLADHPNVRVTPETAAATPIFWGHGTLDTAIPFAVAEQGRATLRAAGARLETRDYPMGHGIAAEEVSDAMEWLRRTVGEKWGEKARKRE